MNGLDYLKVLTAPPYALISDINTDVPEPPIPDSKSKSPLSEYALERLRYIAHAVQRERVLNRAIAKVLDKRFPHLASILRHCGCHRIFRWSNHKQRWKLHDARFCKNFLICPRCCAHRQFRLARIYRQRCKRLIKANPSYRIYAVTLTLRAGVNLREKFDQLTNVFRKYWRQARRHQWDKNRRRLELSCVVGGVIAIEIGRSANGAWTPHLHAIFLCDHKLSESRLSKEWVRLTGGYIVKVQRLTPPKKGERFSALDYVLKGMCRPKLSQNFDEQCEFQRAIENRAESYFELLNLTLRIPRMVWAVGLLRGVHATHPANPISDMSRSSRRRGRNDTRTH
jgi:hypothetical protein